MCERLSVIQDLAWVRRFCAQNPKFNQGYSPPPPPPPKDWNFSWRTYRVLVWGYQESSPPPQPENENWPQVPVADPGFPRRGGGRKPIIWEDFLPKTAVQMKGIELRGGCASLAFPWIRQWFHYVEEVNNTISSQWSIAVCFGGLLHYITSEVCTATLRFT